MKERLLNEYLCLKLIIVTTNERKMLVHDLMWRYSFIASFAFIRISAKAVAGLKLPTSNLSPNSKAQLPKVKAES